MRGRAPYGARQRKAQPATLVHTQGPVRVDVEIQPRTGVWWPVIVVGDSFIHLKLDPNQREELRAALDLFDREAERAEAAEKGTAPFPIIRRLDR